MNRMRIVMLGDIHEQAFIKVNAGYAGSLIQQNLGENDRKGYIIWDTNSKKGEFRRIENRNKFVKLDLRGKTDDENNNMIEKVVQASGSIRECNNILKLSVITD